MSAFANKHKKFFQYYKQCYGVTLKNFKPALYRVGQQFFVAHPAGLPRSSKNLTAAGPFVSAQTSLCSFSLTLCRTFVADATLIGSRPVGQIIKPG